FGVQFSQLHSLALADMDGDGLLDLVTGKTWLAHDLDDPGVDQPAVLYWFRLTRAAGQAEFVPHLIDDDSGIGRRGITTDLDNDGRLDIVIGNKKGLFVFTRTGKEPATAKLPVVAAPAAGQKPTPATGAHGAAKSPYKTSYRVIDVHVHGAAPRETAV